VKRFFSTLAAALLLLVAAGRPCPAQTERILAFDSRVEIAADGDLTVTETIRVLATGQTIRHGIVREFPTTYATPDGKTVTVGFRLLSARRDGHKEDWHIKDAENGKKIYLGDKDELVAPGEHVYALTYATDGQLGLFDDFDELYWNVTGNGWRLPIDAATATIQLPPGATVGQYAAYTGPAGAKGRDFRAFPEADAVVFETTRPLPPGQGFTVAVSFPKGFVHLPSPMERTVRSRAFAIAAAGLVTAAGFFLIAWLRVGRDPARGLTIPLFYPPENLSAPAARYVRRMGFDDKTFAAALVDLAVAGGVVIEDTGSAYTLARGKAGFPAGSWQAALVGKLLGQGDSLLLEQKNHAAVSAARKALTASLAGSCQGTYFQTNRSWFFLGAALSAAVFGLAAWQGDDPETAGIFLGWLGIWTYGAATLAIRAMTALGKARRRPGIMSLAGALLACLFAVPFLIGEVVGVALLSLAVSLPAAGCLAVIAVLNAVFWHLLKAPTKAGRKIMDAIEGFRLYLSVGERERLNLLNPPERTPELFEKYLPYALALDVENAWAAQFAEVLAKAAAEGYAPAWYVGHAFSSGHFSDFADNLGSGFSSAISSAGTAPGSSSGSGGGGSSGGGGGGGGGGGW